MANEERTEQATQRRKEEARKKGQIARSPDLTSSVVFLAIALVFPSFIAGITQGFMKSMQIGLQGAAETNISRELVLKHFLEAASPAFLGCLPIFGVCVLLGVGVTLLQVGFLWTTQPLKPDLNRINPLSGFQRLFSGRSAVELAKTVIKTVMIVWVVWKTVNAEMPGLLLTSSMPADIGWSVIGNVVYLVAVRVGMLWLILAGFDYGYQRWMTDKSMRMTKEEVKREFKEMEANPFVRMKIKQKQRQLARKRQMQDVPNADVVITNPTTYAVAIRYDTATMSAPRILAKGKLKTAEKIREIAMKHNIPIVPNPPLARELYATVEVGDEIPNTLFQAVAQVLAYVYSLRNRRKSA